MRVSFVAMVMWDTRFAEANSLTPLVPQQNGSARHTAKPDVKWRDCLCWWKKGLTEEKMSYKKKKKKKGCA